MRHVLTCALVAFVGCSSSGTELADVRRGLAAEQEELTFPASYVGESQVAEASFRATGESAVRLRASLANSAGVFSLLDEEAVAQPGSSAVIRVRFQPFSDGGFSGTLTIEHDGGDSGVLSIRLSAATRPPPGCSDDNPCTADSFDFIQGCLHVPIAGDCDDGSACTEDDTCVAGACRGSAVICDDGYPCTVDTCDAARGCEHLPTASICADTDPCTVDECIPGTGGDATGCIHSVAVDGTLCGDPTCASVPLCLSGQCASLPTPDGYPCEDGNQCTFGDACFGGECVPGTGASPASTTPVIVRDGPPPPPRVADGGMNAGAPMDEPPDDADAGTAQAALVPLEQLFGQWVVTVDGVASVPSGGREDAIVLWRGNNVADACYMNVASCVLTQPCTTGEPVWSAGPVRLNASIVTPDGVAWRHHQADMAAVLSVLSPTWTDVQTYVVQSVSAVPMPDGLAVGAAVRFTSNCSCADPSSEQPAACSPDALVLAAFKVTVDGFQLVDSLWLETTGTGTQSLRDGDGIPLVASARTDGGFALVFGQQSQMDCECMDCVCPSRVNFFTRKYNLLQATNSLYDEYSVTLETAAGADGTPVGFANLRASVVDDEVTFTWLQSPAVAPSPPPLVCPYQTQPSPLDAWAGNFALNDLRPSHWLIRSHAADAALLAHDGATIDLVWWRTFVAEEGFDDESTVCFIHDEIHAGPDATGTVLLTRDSYEATQLASVDLTTVDGRAYAIATDYDGTVHVVTPAPGAAAHQTSAFPPGEHRFHPESRVRIAPTPAGAIIAGVAEAGIWRNSYPWPALSIAKLGCGEVTTGP